MKTQTLLSFPLITLERLISTKISVNEQQSVIYLKIQYHIFIHEPIFLFPHFKSLHPCNWFYFSCYCILISHLLMEIVILLLELSSSTSFCKLVSRITLFCLLLSSSYLFDSWKATTWGKWTKKRNISQLNGHSIYSKNCKSIWWHHTLKTSWSELNRILIPWDLTRLWFQFDPEPVSKWT